MSPERAFVLGHSVVCLHFCSPLHSSPEKIAHWAPLFLGCRPSLHGSCAGGFSAPSPLEGRGAGLALDQCTQLLPSALLLVLQEVQVCKHFSVYSVASFGLAEFSCWRFQLSQLHWGSQHSSLCNQLWCLVPTKRGECKSANISLCILLFNQFKFRFSSTHCLWDLGCNFPGPSISTFIWVCGALYGVCRYQQTTILKLPWAIGTLFRKLSPMWYSLLFLAGVSKYQALY
jgi:hypothetical protein